MPWNRALYPDNWDEIARQVKEESDWCCEQCGRPCREPGESIDDFEERLDGDLRYMSEGSPLRWIDDLYESVFSEADGFEADVMKPQRFTLTVAHLDHQPENCDRANLKALCAPCHCRYDLSQMARKKQLKAERLGQLTLLD